MENIKNQSPWPATALLFALILGVSIVGYLGFTLYTSLELQKLNVGSLFLLAPIAGIAAFFSPCSFPLLATILGRTIDTDKPKSIRRKQAFQYALALSVGVSAFLLLVGMLLALGAGSFLQNIETTSRYTQWLRIILGTILIVLSLIQIGKIPKIFHRLSDTSHGFLRAQAKIRRKNPWLGFLIYGFAYVIAGFG